MPFPEKFLEEVVERNDIESVVGEYVRLDHRSGSNIFGLCPFHSEKSPSFSVRPSTQTYHCFGCGKGGGVINFIMEIENLSFPEAVEVLAKRAGMQMPEDSFDKESQKKKKLLALNKDAARFFYDQLSQPSGRPAVEYIQKRGISPKYVKNFGLGYAPDTWDSLSSAMKAKGYTDWDLFDAGLVSRSDKSGRLHFYDKFRNRLMFPIINVKGDVIGFSGRTLGNDAAKYMNSPDTVVYDKSRNLFALNLAKKTKAGHLILVEGNVDVVSLHQAGFDCAVASLGTALTEAQAQLISRYTHEVIICYDNDGAGAKASDRAIKILEKLDLKVKVLRVKDAKDPDEFIKAKGPAAFQKLIDECEDQMDYRLRMIKNKYDISVPDQAVTYLKEAAQLFARVPDAAVRMVYAKVIADELGPDYKTSQITELIERYRKNLLRSTKKAEEKNALKITKTAAQLDHTHYDDPQSAAAEKIVIGLLYRDPALARDPTLPAPEEFSADNLRHIYSVLLERILDDRSTDIQYLGEDLTKDEISVLALLNAAPVDSGNVDLALQDSAAKIRNNIKHTKAINETADLSSLAERLRKKKGYGEQQS